MEETPQTLKINLELYPPKDSRIVSVAELHELQEGVLKGVWWKFSDLVNRVGHERNWLKENILFVPHFKDILDVRNGGCVFYPPNKNTEWRFEAHGMAEFLKEYFPKIHIRLLEENEIRRKQKNE